MIPVFVEISLLLVPFAAWCISWWGYISGKYSLTGDAYFSYWDDRFFLDNISHGIYPLWNSHYEGGVPWNFFLRRMGEVNPFWWIINVLKFLGVSAVNAHLIFLVLYFFLGLIGFWLLAKFFLKDTLTAIGAYLLLLFSWGAQLFYCFEVLEFVPLIWFFYFLFSFAVEQKKHQFLGILFTLGLLLSTYVPFFSLTVISCVLFFVVIFFIKETWNFIKASGNFVARYKLFTVMSLCFLLLACLPAMNFYGESKNGGFVLPTRHLGSTDASVLAVTTDSINQQGSVAYSRTIWDIIAYGDFDRIFADQKNMTLSDFNIAFLFFLIPLVCVINPLSRRTAVLIFPAVFLGLMNITCGHVYQFLIGHVFFYHYMRMLQLFLWLGVLPLAILMVMEQLRVFILNQQGRRNIAVLIWVVIVHLAFLAYLLGQQGVSWSSYVAVALSFVLFVFLIMGFRRPLCLALILAAGLMVQPLCFAQYIANNSVLSGPKYVSDHSNFYDKDFGLLHHGDPVVLSGKEAPVSDIKAPALSNYYENPWFADLKQDIDDSVLQQFLLDKLMLYDNGVPDDNVSHRKFARVMRRLEDEVFLSKQENDPQDFRILAPQIHQAQVIDDQSPQVKVLSYDANTLMLQTNLDHPKFLLWANGYHPGWKVYIDGQESRVLRADFAFKGLWLPEGVHRIVFRFLIPWQYFLEYVILISYVIVLGMILYGSLRD